MMTIGQLVTVLTIGAAAATGLCGLILGVLVWLSPETSFAVSRALGMESVHPGWMGALVGAAGIFIAIGLVQAQQAIVAVLYRRELDKIRESYREVELALGTEKATEFLEWKLRQMRQDTKTGAVDIFG